MSSRQAQRVSQTSSDSERSERCYLYNIMHAGGCICDNVCKSTSSVSISYYAIIIPNITSSDHSMSTSGQQCSGLVHRKSYLLMIYNNMQDYDKIVFEGREEDYAPGVILHKGQSQVWTPISSRTRLRPRDI